MIKIDNKFIGENYKPYIVAELSANHDGSIKKALKTIYQAHKNGADAIKLQSYTPDTITLNSNKKDFIINSGNWKGQTLYELYKKAHTPFEWHKDLFSYSKKIGITCFSTPFDFSAIDLLEKLNCPAYKIASFEIVDLPLIKEVAKTKKPIILSTGMANIKEIKDAVNTIKRQNNSKIIILHCISGYPTPISEISLGEILKLKKNFKTVVGLSDHTLGTFASTISVSFGAALIEKHFTIDKKNNGTDSFFSITKKDLKKLREDTILAWKAKNTKKNKLKKSEKDNFKFRRSLYIIKNIKKGEKFSSDNIRSVRPGYGLEPKYYNYVIGKKSKKNLKKHIPLKKSYIDE